MKPLKSLKWHSRLSDEGLDGRMHRRRLFGCFKLPFILLLKCMSM